MDEKDTLELTKDEETASLATNAIFTAISYRIAHEMRLFVENSDGQCSEKDVADISYRIIVDEFIKLRDASLSTG